MKKFSESQINEEFFSIFKRKNSSESKEFIKTSINLLKMYCDNLISNDFMILSPAEKENYDFEFYKIQSIVKVKPNGFKVSMITYDIDYKKLYELNYLLEII